MTTGTATTRRRRSCTRRFGGDEFCFLIPDLAEYQQAYTVADRFREAVERYDWTLEDERLAAQPVRVDVGVVCLWLGRINDRRAMAHRLAAGLINRADKLMYEAKGERASHIFLMRARVSNGELIEMTDDEKSSKTGGDSRPADRLSAGRVPTPGDRRGPRVAADCGARTAAEREHSRASGVLHFVVHVHASTRVVGVAQRLERRTVAPEAAGSSPVIHPTQLLSQQSLSNFPSRRLHNVSTAGGDAGWFQ